MLFTMLTQFSLVDYALSFEESKENNNVVKMVLSNMPTEQKIEYLKNIKEWIFKNQKVEYYEEKYIDGALEHLDNDNFADNSQGFLSSLSSVDFDMIEEGVQKIINVAEGNSYSNCAMNGNLRYQYIINPFGVIKINVFTETEKIFSMLYTGNWINTDAMNMFEMSNFLFLEYKFDKELFDKNDKGIVEDYVDYYIKRNIKNYSIICDRRLNNKLKSKKLVKLNEDGINNIIYKKSKKA